MKQRKGGATFQGAPLTLLGEELKVGDSIPDCTLINCDLQPVKLSSFKGKNLIIFSVPSLDTSVCDLEARRFNEEASKLDNFHIICVSMDLPFAQKRWCGAHGIKEVETLSDHREASFGQSFGVLILELRLLARSVFLVDAKGTLRYVQHVKEMTEQPRYEEITREANNL